jgi:hypothetical protein
LLVLDTSVIIASLDRTEPRHATCQRLIESSQERLVVPAPTLCEVDHFLHRRLGASAMPAFLDRARSGELDVEDLTPEDLDRTIELMQRYADLDVGFVDAAVLSIVERLGALRLATLDRRHFSVMQPRHVDALELVPS